MIQKYDLSGPGGCVALVSVDGKRAKAGDADSSFSIQSISKVFTLVNGGKNPVTGVQAVGQAHIQRILAVMATAGLYDDSGIWLYRVGLPAKSGVGGGIIAVAPGRFGIAAFSPPVDPAGNSVRAQKAIQHLAAALAANPYNTKPFCH